MISYDTVTLHAPRVKVINVKLHSTAKQDAHLYEPATPGTSMDGTLSSISLTVTVMARASYFVRAMLMRRMRPFTTPVPQFSCEISREVDGTLDPSPRRKLAVCCSRSWIVNPFSDPTQQPKD